MSASLRAILYRSNPVVGFDKDQILQMLDKARKHNESAGISGALLYTNQRFIQYIEGSSDVINQLWSNIQQDTRHKEVVLMLDTPVYDRLYAGFHMDFREVSEQSVSSLLVEPDTMLLALMRQFT